jgi:cytochrome c biogenesis factor
MKKSIVTLAIFTLSFTNGIAKETTSKTDKLETTVSKDQIVEIFDWSVKTTQGHYAGTANSLEEANKMIVLATTNEIIIEKKVESFYQIKNQEVTTNNRLYFWEAHTASGYAKGFSNSESQAIKMIELIGKGDILNYKIIQSNQY